MARQASEDEVRVRFSRQEARVEARQEAREEAREEAMEIGGGEERVR